MQKMTNLLSEGLEHKDLVDILKPTIHIDEFASKMGDDDDIIVASFYVRSRQAADDLVNWFEKGYDWVLDADVSPGEIRPGRYLVYVEMRRRSSAGKHITDALEDLETLTEFHIDEWKMTYNDQTYQFDQATFEKLVPLSPKEYRRRKEVELNEMRAAAGIQPVQIFEREKDVQSLQSAAGIK